jgi:very-short-patch-repair endonuclease
MTHAEHIVWSRLSGRRFCGLRFVRQFPIGPYVADFCCRQRRIVVEIDGGQHAGNAGDVERTRALEALGFRVMRYWNTDVTENIDGVMEDLHRRLIDGGFTSAP